MFVWLDQRRTEGLPPIGGRWGSRSAPSASRRRSRRSRRTARRTGSACTSPRSGTRSPTTSSSRGSSRTASPAASSIRSAARSATSRSTTGTSGGPPPVTGSGSSRRSILPSLPGLVPPTQRLGEITAAASEATGIPAGLPAIAAAADKACEVLGSGALEPTIGALSFGTTATFNTTQRKYVEAIPLVPPYPAALPGAWSVETQVHRGFWLVEWYLREFGHADEARAASLGMLAHEALDELAGSVPPGSMGLTVQPHVVPGHPHPGPRGEGGGHRVRRRPHPRPRVPGDPRGARLRAPRGEGADREEDRRDGHAAPGRRRRGAERRRGAAHGGRLRAAGGAPPHARGVRPRGGDRRGGRPRDPPRRPDRRARDDARRDPSTIRTRRRTRSTTSSTRRCTGGCTTVSGRSTRRSGGSPATRAPSDGHALSGVTQRPGPPGRPSPAVRRCPDLEPGSTGPAPLTARTRHSPARSPARNCSRLSSSVIPAARSSARNRTRYCASGTVAVPSWARSPAR